MAVNESPGNIWVKCCFHNLAPLPPLLVVVTVWTDPSVSFKLRLLASVSVPHCSGLDKRDNNPPILRFFTGKAGSPDQHGFAASMCGWILNAHEGKQGGSCRRLDKHGAFLSVTLGSVDCTSARLGLSRSAAFIETSTILIMQHCNKHDTFHLLWPCVSARLALICRARF